MGTGAAKTSDFWSQAKACTNFARGMQRNGKSTLLAANIKRHKQLLGQILGPDTWARYRVTLQAEKTSCAAEKRSGKDASTPEHRGHVNGSWNARMVKPSRQSRAGHKCMAPTGRRCALRWFSVKALHHLRVAAYSGAPQSRCAPHPAPPYPEEPWAKGL